MALFLEVLKKVSHSLLQTPMPHSRRNGQKIPTLLNSAKFITLSKLFVQIKTAWFTRTALSQSHPKTTPLNFSSQIFLLQVRKQFPPQLTELKALAELQAEVTQQEQDMFGELIQLQTTLLLNTFMCLTM